MRFILLFSCICLCASSVWAQALKQELKDELDRVPTKEKRAQYIREAQKAYNDCTAQYDYNKAYDCRCIAGNLYQVRLDSDDFFSHTDIIRDSLPICKDAPKFAHTHYEQCLSWAASVRRDAEEFCQCYGNSMGRNFERKTFQSPQEEEGIMAHALGECNFGADAKERARRARIKKDLEKRGLFQRLFPSFFPSPDTPPAQKP